MVQGVKIKGRKRPDEVARSAKGRRRRPVERAPEAPRFHVCALRAHFQQKYGKEKHDRDKQGSFPGSFVRSTVQVSWFWGPPKIVQNRSEKLLGHRVGRKSVPKVAWEAPGRPETRFTRMSGAIWAAKGATSDCDPGFPGLQLDRRGGVGEG